MIRAAVVSVVLAASATTASAGVYGSLGLGNTGIDDSATTSDFTAASRSLRFAAGYQFIPFIGVEGGVIGYDVAHGRAAYDGREVYAAAVGHFPIANGFGAFGRLGVQHTGLSTDSNQGDLSGTGYIFGAGFEYKLPLRIPSIASASLWVDYTRNNQGLEDDTGRAVSNRSIGESMWTLGVTVGL